MENQKILQKKKRELGASLVEYGLLVALIAGISIVAVKTTGTKVNAVFIGTSLQLNAGAGDCGPSCTPP